MFGSEPILMPAVVQFAQFMVLISPRSSEMFALHTRVVRALVGSGRRRAIGKVSMLS
jgi:hypothetical protein